MEIAENATIDMTYDQEISDCAAELAKCRTLGKDITNLLGAEGHRANREAIRECEEAGTLAHHNADIKRERIIDVKTNGETTGVSVIAKRGTTPEANDRGQNSYWQQNSE